ncbi:MAG: helix-turn-helix domain-containing protein [Actinobacteria bacterium]|nr:helix-turn-helix domain-containing protein [Actinomycetota bacterium]
MNTVKHPEADAYVPTAEASKITGLAEQTLHNFRSIHQGPPYVKVGRAVRYSIRDLLAWMEMQKVVPGEAVGADASNVCE